MCYVLVVLILLIKLSAKPVLFPYKAFLIYKIELWHNVLRFLRLKVMKKWLSIYV